MAIYLIPIKTAMIFFPLLAALFTLPYIISQYRRYGAIPFMRSAILYSFIFYLLCAYLLTMLPLPDPKTVASLTTPTMQLIPFQAIQDFISNSPFVLNDPSTYLATLNSPAFYILFFNLFLLLPFGIYMRYYFKFSWKKTLFLTFLVSLSFECIQRSALFGIYPRPYRIFDIDDLITNTLGGMFGYAMTPLIAHFLPTREELDQSAYRKGMQVSFFRRAIAFTIDMSFVGLGLLGIYSYDYLLHRQINYQFLISAYLMMVLFFFVLIPTLTSGKTIGKFFVRIRIMKDQDHPAKWYQYLIHYPLLYGMIMPMPFVLYYLIKQFLVIEEAYRVYYLIATLVLGVGFVFSLYQIIYALINEQKQPFYARLSKLRNISTVVDPMHIDDEVMEASEEVVEAQPTIEASTSPRNETKVVEENQQSPDNRPTD